MKVKKETYLLSEFVHFKRTKVGLTQSRLAELSNCSALTINNIENCNSNVAFATGMAVLRALGSTLTEFENWTKGKAYNAN